MYRDVAGIYIERCRFKSAMAVFDIYNGTFAVFTADIQNVITVNGVVACGYCDVAACDVKELFGVYCVVDRSGNIKRQITYGHPRFALFISGRAGFYSAFAVCGDVQCAGAGKSYL